MKSFYDYPKNERVAIAKEINANILDAIENNSDAIIIKYFSDKDTYIRKAAYLAIGQIYLTHENLHQKIKNLLSVLLDHQDELVRQTVVNSFGEIGKFDGTVMRFLEKAIFDPHHKVKNAVIGSLKKMGEINPKYVLDFASKYLTHEDPEIRRQMVHGIELRGRTHPEEVLPILKKLQFEKVARVRNMVSHVIGQIAYKKGCLETVIAELNTWDNKELVKKSIEEIIEVHGRYEKFSVMTQKEAEEYIQNNLRL